MRVLLVDDHVVVRQGLRLLLESEADLEIVGEAANGRHAVQLTRELRPDIVLMDVQMPEMDGIEATGIIHRDTPHICIVGLSMFAHDRHAERMRDAGAMDYVTKSASPNELLAVLRGCYARMQEQLSLE